ncbi:hypothetical protein OG321_42185 [Streptomyces sp. NBC_00424]|uniref:hypothetical protein n=1 Tax=Streptomyces sp. NBC_00424 TaxID=2903648 RepID=UPI00224C9F76|nr:hypothetical protein [Streptomyces sp. NBC_00424]MCX5079007.1 hypothetical protein [Streptomyces sp. NBC_00424]
MSVGFRPTPADNEIIQAHKRPEESTSDVLRRALRALDRQKWDDQARQDMERIAASGEDLAEEPDDWGYDEDGHPSDQRDRLHTPPAGESRPAPTPAHWDPAPTSAGADSTLDGLPYYITSVQGSIGVVAPTHNVEVMYSTPFVATLANDYAKADTRVASHIAAGADVLSAAALLQGAGPTNALEGMKALFTAPRGEGRPRPNPSAGSWRIAHLHAVAARRAGNR